MAWLMVGIFTSRSVHLSRVAAKIPGKAVLNSTIQRLRRFLDNSAVRVREWYEPVARDLLLAQARSGQGIRLLVDGSKVGFGHQLLMVAIAYRRRAVPIAWTWVKGNRGHSSAAKQAALLKYVRSLIPGDIPVFIAGDSEFGAIPVLKLLDAWQWKYVLRQKSSHVVYLDGQDWQPFGNLIEKAGLVTKQFRFRSKGQAEWKAARSWPSIVQPC